MVVSLGKKYPSNGCNCVHTTHTAFGPPQLSPVPFRARFVGILTHLFKLHVQHYLVLRLPACRGSSNKGSRNTVKNMYEIISWTSNRIIHLFHLQILDRLLKQSTFYYASRDPTGLSLCYSGLLAVVTSYDTHTVFMSAYISWLLRYVYNINSLCFKTGRRHSTSFMGKCSNH